MNYRVIIQPPARNEMEEAYRWIAERSPTRAAAWLNGLQRAINTLEAYPQRCPLARENEAFREEVRHLLYGRGRGTYRIVFVIRGGSVYVTSIRHSARQPLSPEEFGDIEGV